MNPQPVQIHGTWCLLRKTGGGSMTSYSVTRRDSGALLALQPVRLLAVAVAARVLNNPELVRRSA